MCDPAHVGNLAGFSVLDPGRQVEYPCGLTVGLSLEQGDPRLTVVLEKVKRKESQGATPMRGRMHSFYLLVNGRVPRRRFLATFVVDRASGSIVERALHFTAVGDSTHVLALSHRSRVMLDGGDH